MAHTIVDPPRTALTSLFSDKPVFPSSEKLTSTYAPTSAMIVVLATVAPSTDDVKAPVLFHLLFYLVFV